MTDRKKNGPVEVVALAALRLRPTEDAIPRGSRVSLAREVAEALVARGDAAWPAAEAPLVDATRPEGQALFVAIGHAMREIDPDEGLTAAGKPSLYALAHHLHYEVTAAERDAAMEMFREKRPGLFDRSEVETVPKAIAERPELMAIHSLDRGNKGLWTRDGRPDSRVLSELLHRAVSAEERDQMWADYEAALR